MRTMAGSAMGTAGYNAPNAPEKLGAGLRFSRSEFDSREGETNGETMEILLSTKTGGLIMKVAVWVCALCALQAVFISQALAEFGQKDVKIVEFPIGPLTTEYIHDNYAQLEQAVDFDGLILDYNAADPTAWPGLRHAVWTKRGMVPSDWAANVNDMATSNFTQFRDNMLRVNTSVIWSGTSGWFADWFDDAGWNTLLTNAGEAAKMAYDSNMAGILLDTENYKFPLFHYESLPGKVDHTRAEYEVKVRERGQQYIQATQAEFADIQLMLTFGYEYSHNAMLSDFIDGMLDGITGDAAIHDGWEYSYSYTSDSQFRNAYDEMTTPALSGTGSPAKFADYYRPGFGIFTDRHPNPDELHRSIQLASHYADRYVWVYSEDQVWFGDPAGDQTNVSQAQIDAISKVRTKGLLERFDDSTKDLTTWEQYSFSGNPNTMITQNNLIYIQGANGGSDYTTASLTAGIGDLVSVEVTPTSTPGSGGTLGLFLTNDSGGAGGRTVDDSHWLGVYWSNTDNVLYAASLDETGFGKEILLAGDHPLDTMYIYEIERLSLTQADFRVYDVYNELQASTTLTFSANIPEELFTSLFSNVSASFDNVWIIPEPATIGLLVLGAVGLLRRRP